MTVSIRIAFDAIVWKTCFHDRLRVNPVARSIVRTSFLFKVMTFHLLGYQQRLSTILQPSIRSGSASSLGWGAGLMPRSKEPPR